jgi:prepilin-type N-terminal cleavage/methylation domain-containing protein
MLQDVTCRARHRARGLTVLELLVAMTVLGVSLAVAIPQVGRQFEKQHIISAAEGLSRELYRARAEALRRNQEVVVSFHGGARAAPASWCYGLHAGSACDCTRPDSCRLEAEEVRRGGSQPGAIHPDIYLDRVSFRRATAVFSPARGLSNGGTVVFSSRSGNDPEEMRLAVVVSTLGRIRLCSPAGDYARIGRYRPC